MIKVQVGYEVGGRRYENPSKAMDAFGASIMQAVGEEVAGQLRDVRCPEHRQPPRVTVVGQSTDQMDIKIEGCCERVVTAAERVLS
jgi:hypothetical protein